LYERGGAPSSVDLAKIAKRGGKRGKGQREKGKREKENKYEGNNVRRRTAKDTNTEEQCYYIYQTNFF
jgi:hypothetical protein